MSGTTMLLGTAALAAFIVVLFVLGAVFEAIYARIRA